MEEKKISLDVHDSTKVSRIFQLVFGILCLIVAVWFLFSLLNTKSAMTSNLIAVAFLFCFGVWEIITSAGITKRYIIISEDRLVIKNRYLAKPETHSAVDINTVIFKPVAFEIHDNNGAKRLVKLGIYYNDRTTMVMEEVEKFCMINHISIEGLKEKNNQI